MTALRLGYVDVFVTDLARAVEFFQQTLGLPLQHHEERLGLGVARIDPAAGSAGRAL
jgi:catechol 2,3-dioxygenase-like lactoylglutathione lyase family enzyme